MKSRRSFLTQSAAVSAGFFGLDRYLNSPLQAAEGFSYGKLLPDPKGILDLPKGFSYRILSRTGDRMVDGYKVPGHPDGMAAFEIEEGKIALIRNHEIGHSGFKKGPFEDNSKLPEGFDPTLSYDAGRFGAQPFVGGTSTVILDEENGEIVAQFLSLTGTDRNCAGGPTPWGTWITCEEPADMTTQWGTHHGYCFEVAATSEPALSKPEPLKAMGRFRHEAVAVDPATGIVYLTEDRNDGVIYRFIASTPGKLAEGGLLQAMQIEGNYKDTRNWPGKGVTFPIGVRQPVKWIDLEDVESPADDLRLQAIKKGATVFSRGEGMWFGSSETVGENSIYWACTDGGAKLTGQIFRYFPDTNAEKSSTGEVELYLEPNDTDLLKNGDNITIAPSGHLYICEDGSGTNQVRGVSRSGEMFTLARNAMNGSEFAGVCFGPSGKTLFVNIQDPGITFAITGPFAAAQT